MLTRDEQIEALARRMLAVRFPNTVKDHPDFFDQLAEPSKERWLALATIAIELAEATRLEDAKIVRAQGYTTGSIALAEAILELPLPIGPAQQVEG